jgi:hypothetical protein
MYRVWRGEVGLLMCQLEAPLRELLFKSGYLRTNQRISIP